ncbi:hypothetical protein GCM10028806_02320 [Spirosoma terrae]|uniref:HEAT repeat domain-containing protein n=1 Tax=Spirosoma terrae TaxID=1968276 RepID=A0A6L9LCN4_9BACT|nr:HEAT repeat domain-containing protein [Spirosoma terrae]NDU98210.1 HEAT repeat domain-containing protein [Spirosoma terrae]
MKQDIEKLLEKYYEGETTLAEEKLLRQFFQQEDVPVHLQSHAGPFRYFAEARDQHPSAVFNNRLVAKLNALEPTPIRRLTSWAIRIAAGVALLLVGFGGGRLYDQWRASRHTSEAVADNENVASAQTIKKVLAFEPTQQTSASERIQAVQQSYELTQVDQDITQLLINTLNFDANVNVRLAACQALARFENETGVREALIQSLTIQSDPNVQLALIDILVAIKEKRAANEIRRLAQNQEALDVVRLKAEEGLTQLIGNQKSPS